MPTSSPDANSDKKLQNEKLCDKLLPAQEPIEKIQVYENGKARELIVPRKVVIVPGIWPQSDYERLKSKAKITTLQDRMAMMEEAERKRKQLNLESQQRKQQLLKSRVSQTPAIGSALDSVENESKQKTMYLLERSNELVKEQDDRVKLASSIILSTKCRAIRNAQIIEKELIKKQMAEENIRLDNMMEQRRQLALKREEEREEAHHKKMEIFRSELDDQIKTNEMNRIVLAEKKFDESKRIKQALIELEQEEQRKLKKKLETQKQTRDDLKKANEELKKFKQIQEEEERIIELRIQNFMKKKLEREQQFEKEMELKRLEKEREIAHLRDLQQKSLDYQSQLEEMNILRIQEEVEREWRRKELEAARKKKEMYDNLKKERQKQVEDLRKTAALNLARDEADFRKVIEVQKIAYEKELKKKQTTYENNQKYRSELMKQIDEKEKERINKIQQKFKDGENQRLQQKMKDKQIEEHLKKKIEKLKDYQIMDNYINDINNALQLKKDS